MGEDVRTKFRYPRYNHRDIPEGTKGFIRDLEKELNSFFHGDFYIEAGLIVKENITVIETPGGITDLTADRALESDSDGNLVVSDITSTELGYLDGASSNIQDQIDAISFTTELSEDTSPVLGGNLDIDVYEIGGYTASLAVVTNVSGQLSVSDITATELGYLDGVTSNIQDQIDAAGGGIENVVEDTTPELGGELDLGAYWIEDTGSKLKLVLNYDGVLVKALTDNAASYVGWEVQPDPASVGIKCELFVPVNPTSTAHCILKYTPDDSDSELRIQHATEGGIRIATSSNDQIGFFGVTPVVQRSTVSDPSGGSTIDAEARTAINAIIDALQDLGLMA